ncbi:MAG TPA: hypothetical protein VI636_00030 [Candidatus Angelobacter sp.]
MTPAEKYILQKVRFVKQYRRVVREVLRLYWLWVEFDCGDECPPPDGYPFGVLSIDEVALKSVEYVSTLKLWEAEGD